MNGVKIINFSQKVTRGVLVRNFLRKMVKIIDGLPCNTLHERRILWKVDLLILANPRLDSNEFRDVTWDAAL